MTRWASWWRAKRVLEIEEKLTLIPFTRLLLCTDKKKAKFIYNPTKRTINWGKYVHFVKVFYTKVSHIRWLTNSPKFTVFLVLKRRKNSSLVLKWQNHNGYLQGVCSKEFNYMKWMAYNASITASQKTCSFSKMWTWLLRNTAEIS